MRGPLCFTLIATAVTSVVAHTTVYGVWINGVFQGDGRDVYVGFAHGSFLVLAQLQRCLDSFSPK